MKARLFSFLAAIAAVPGARRALITVAAASALASVLPGNAAAAPNHSIPAITCQVLYGQVWLTVPMPMSVQTPYKSEAVALRYYLFKKNQYGGWDVQERGQSYYTNFATYAGALLGGWLPDGNDLHGGAAADTFYPTSRGVYAVAMYLVWGDPLKPRDKSYVWTNNTCTIS
jgi:hypothetical protein